MTETINYAPAPKRATVAFTMNFGLVPVKMRLFATTEEIETNKRHQYVEVDGENHPVGVMPYDKETGEPVPKDVIVKKVTLPNPYPRPGEPEVLVPVTDEEIALVTDPTKVDRGDVPIEAFIPLDTIGTRYHVKNWYQVRPALRQVKKASQPDPQADKAFALLMAALEAKQVAALVRFSLRAEPRYAAITPDGNLHILHFDSEVRAPFPTPDIEVAEAHIQGASNLIDAWGIDTPALVDESGEALVEYLTSKAKGGKVIEAPPVVEQTEEEPDLDFDLLLANSAQVVKSSKKSKANA
jgi:non-homologous end joining protein Ku